ncbi:MAG: acetate--CoA ligase family protein [Pseudonocardiales bacterium]|nr:acetate--CoA ligase family protein [Pseudonocardiales bacterium]
MPMLSGLEAVFAPRRVALVGASERPGTMGELFWRNLASFPGEVVPVTPSRRSLGGVKAYPSLASVDGEVDLAVVVVRAAEVPGVIRDAGVKGVPAALVISGGFAETGPDGAALQSEVVAIARAGGVRIVGPNCFGVQNCDLPLNASMATGLPPGGGGITLATQSGSYGMAIHTLGLDERTRFAKVYAIGNKADIGDAEVLRYLATDPASRTLCFFLESLPDGREFCDAARMAGAAGKPVIVARTGRTPAGIRAAQSHTAALAGSARIWRAALQQAGVLVARSGLEMLDAARALDAQPPPAGNRIAVVTNSGGTGVELADLLADEGLAVPELSAALQDKLRPVLPKFASAANPVDITPVWRRFAELYPRVVDELAHSGEVDAIVPVLLQRAAVDETVAAGLRDAVTRLRSAGVGIPVYVCWVAPRSARANADLLQEAGVPCFEWPERTARAVGHAVRFGVASPRPAAPLPALPGPIASDDLPARHLDPDQGANLLRTVGIATVESITCTGASGAVAAAQRIGYPVVCKVVHPDLVHRSNAGGVRLNLNGPDAVRAAAQALLGLAEGACVQVQPQLVGVEVAVGGLRDAQFGPIVMIGLGGIWIEVIGDVVFGLAPLAPDEAHRLIAGLRGHAVLTGARGREPVNLDALAATVSAVGNLLVARPEVVDLDLNPLLATSRAAVAVDWRITVRG